MIMGFPLWQSEFAIKKKNFVGWAWGYQEARECESECDIEDSKIRFSAQGLAFADVGPSASWEDGKADIKNAPA
jgi:hypothetical protein